MNDQLAGLLKLVEHELTKIGFSKEPKSLYHPAEYLLSIGGKRLRPIVTLLGCGVFSNPLEAMPQALAIEVFHNFSLMHDDIMDDAPLRRGKQTVHEKWNLNTAILSGDVMLVKAFQLVANCEPKILPQVLNTFSQTAIEVCEGQQYDMDFENRDWVAEAEYVSMIQQKTSVLLGCALQLGAIVGGATKADAERLYNFGLLLGTSFQIKDDWLDCFGEPGKVGKQVGGDIIANKKTLLLIHALNTAEGTQKEQLVEWLSKDDFDNKEKVRAVKSLYQELGTGQYAQERMEDFYNQALSHLGEVSVGSKQELYDFARWLFEREN